MCALDGNLVQPSTVVQMERITHPPVVTHCYPPVDQNPRSSRPSSTGQATKAMEAAANGFTTGFDYAWTGTLTGAILRGAAPIILV